MRIELDEPRTVRTVRNSYYLECDGAETLQLPVKETEIKYTESPEGRVAVAVEIPMWIAIDRGLTGEPKETEPVETMSRHDWFTLGAIIGLLASGRDRSSLLWDAQKIADKATEQ